MARKSTAAVSSLLVEFGAATSTFGAKQVMKADTEYGPDAYRLPMARGYSLCDETYGRDSRLYTLCPNVDTRRRLERFLEARGVKVNRGYDLTNPTVDVSVSYFKGHNWDE